MAGAVASAVAVVGTTVVSVCALCGLDDWFSSAHTAAANSGPGESRVSEHLDDRTELGAEQEQEVASAHGADDGDQLAQARVEDDRGAVAERRGVEAGMEALNMLLAHEGSGSGGGGRAAEVSALSVLETTTQVRQICLLPAHLPAAPSHLPPLTAC